MLRVEEVSTFEDFLKLEPVWNDLLSQTDADCPFLTFEWISCWWKSFAHDSKLYILLVKDEERLLAVFPLMKTKYLWRGFFLNAITLITNYHSFRSGFIVSKEIEKEVMDCIFKHIEGSKYKYDIICFDLIPKDSISSVIVSNGLISKSIKFKEMQSCSSPYIPVEDTWDSYLKGRSKNLRHRLNQIKNMVKKIGDCEVIRYSSNGYDEAMEEIVNISKKTWKYDNKTAIANDIKIKEFYLNITKEHSASQKAIFTILKLDKIAAAFEIILYYKQKAYLLKIGYDESLRTFSPGLMLLSYSIKESFECKLKEYDFLGENEEYKKKWASLTKEHTKFLIFGETWRSKCLFFLETKLIPLSKKFYSLFRK